MTIDPTVQAQPPLSDREASNISRDTVQPQLAAFVAALAMRRPVSTDKAALLLEHSVKDQMTADAQLIADQMRLDHWEECLSDGESVELLAARAVAFLDTEGGVKLFNFFAKTFARTSGNMYE